MRLLILILFLNSCSQTTDQAINPILGMWELAVMELKDTETGKYRIWKDGMTGYLLYEKSGFMSLHLMPKSYPNTDLVFKNFTDTMPEEQLKYITQNYNYMGRYTVDYDKNIVSHEKLSHSNPNEWGEIAVRSFSFLGDTLVIKPTEEKNAGLRLKLTKKQ